MNQNEIVLNLEPSKEFPRHSEGAFVTLADGKVLFIYTRFSGGSGDHAAAELVGITSDDSGASWSEPSVAVPNDGGWNVMSVSLLRLQDGRIALFYLRKNSMLDCRPVISFSDDEAETWSEPQETFTVPAYHVLNNDRVIQMKSGRLVMPISFKRPRHGDAQQGNASDMRGIAIWYLSDDGGATWRESQNWWALPVNSRSGMQEPGVVELSDGTLFSWIRTDQGRQYECRSVNGGEHWTSPQPTLLESPTSPASIKAMPDNDGELLAIYNDHSGRFPFPAKRRTPLVSAISTDGAHSWDNHKILEDDPDGWYCYTAIHFINGKVLLGYCAGDREVGGLNRLRIRCVSLDWLRSN